MAAAVTVDIRNDFDVLASRVVGLEFPIFCFDISYRDMCLVLGYVLEKNKINSIKISSTFGLGYVSPRIECVGSEFVR